MGRLFHRGGFESIISSECKRTIKNNPIADQTKTGFTHTLFQLDEIAQEIIDRHESHIPQELQLCTPRAGGGNRTRMGQAPLDFESSASTNFTTPACRFNIEIFV